MSGFLLQNIAHFARALRRAGLPVGPSAVLEATRAVTAIGVNNKQDFYWSLHSVFVKRRDHSVIFHQAFQLFFKKHDVLEKLLQSLLPTERVAQKEKPAAGSKRVADAFRASREPQKEEGRQEIERDARFSMSSKDVLQEKDFAQMSADEILHAKQAIKKLVLPVDKQRTKRFQAALQPGKIDPCQTVRHSLKTGGDVLVPRFKKPRYVVPKLVALCDISGSMTQYSRLFLHFLHTLGSETRRVDSFLFGTRLTNVTRQLSAKDPDEALAACSEGVRDWSGGTRIASSLRQFNKDWSRRVLGQGAIVLLITDGLERDGADLLDCEMDRLHRSCKRLIWLNPLLRYDGFQARGKGIRIMLNHVDEFRAIHSLDTMQQLCSLLSQPAHNRENPRHWLQ